MEKKVGILTWHDPSNCGSALQAYALQTYLCEQGTDAQIIRYVPLWCRGDCMLMPWRQLSFKQKLKRLTKTSLLPLYYHLPRAIQQRISPFFPFYNQCCRMTQPCTEANIAEVCKPFTTIISGSDQIWNPNHIDSIFLQNFAANNVNKISYAASLGGKVLPDEYTSLYKDSLKKFGAISVRENDGLELLKAIGITADVHVDPTLLLSASHYRSLEKPVVEVKKPFAFCYFLTTDIEYRSQVQEYVKQHNLETVGFSAQKEDSSWMKIVNPMGPREWLWLIDNADVVMTNSYHATLLSLILHTPFFTFLRFDSKSNKSQNARLEQLNSYFGIADYLVSSEFPNIPAYPFSKFDEKLPVLQQKARKYLLGNIK